MKSGSRIIDHEKEDRIASGWLLHYDDRLEELTLKLKDIEEAAPSSLGGNQHRNGSGISDPTARKALAMATAEIEHMEAWLALIREVEAELPDRLRIFLRLRRQYRFCRGPNGWIPQVQRKYAAEMAKIEGKAEEKTWRSDRTLAAYWAEMVDYSARLAIRKGIL